MGKQDTKFYMEKQKSVNLNLSQGMGGGNTE